MVGKYCACLGDQAWFGPYQGWNQTYVLVWPAKWRHQLPLEQGSLPQLLQGCWMLRDSGWFFAVTPAPACSNLGVSLCLMESRMGQTKRQFSHRNGKSISMSWAKIITIHINPERSSPNTIRKVLCDLALHIHTRNSKCTRYLVGQACLEWKYAVHEPNSFPWCS